MKYSIQYKILIPFSIIIFFGLATLLFVSYNINEQHASQIIEKDMIAARKNLDLYLAQYFLINNMELNKKSLELEMGNISPLLSSQIGNDVRIYDSNGNQAGTPFNIGDTLNEDFSKALTGETAYSIHHLEDRVLVTLSYPIEDNHNIIGIIRYSKDYTELYDYNKKFKTIIHLFAVTIFIFIFLTAFLLSKQITKPIKELIKSSEQVSSGDFNLNIRSTSRDEIGELAERFTKMAERIKEQIEIIEKDRDTLKEVQAQNKAFFDNATHELKTPLTTILGYAQVLKDNGFSDKEFFNKGTSYIIKESKRLNNLVLEILELSKASSIEYRYDFDEVDLSGLIKETSNEMRIKGKKYNIHISCDVQDKLVCIGDKNKLKEVLINLIDNAIKYGKVNSTVYVEAYKEGKTIFLQVKDQGEGIPKQHLKRVFDPFYRVSQKTSRESSSGLGLTIVKSIVERHGGTIKIKSTLNEGSKVMVELGGGHHI